MKTILTEYTIPVRSLPKSLTFIVVSDLHNSPYEELLPLLTEADALLIPGDLADRYRNRYEKGVAFLRESSALLPVFFSPGNHDLAISPFRSFWTQVLQSGAKVLYNEWTEYEGLAIGGAYLSTPYSGLRKGMGALQSFIVSKQPKLLLCHRPEEVTKIAAGRAADLVISGHAHGGQIRIGSQGLYAPGQGIFPMLTKGRYEPNLLVSAGVGNPAGMPRWGNPPEILRVRLIKAEEG